MCYYDTIGETIAINKLMDKRVRDTTKSEERLVSKKALKKKL